MVAEPSRGSVTFSGAVGCVPKGCLLDSPVESRLEERRRWVKSLKSTILDRAARRRDACRLMFEVGRAELVTDIDHGLLLVEVGERRGWGSGHSSEVGGGLAVALRALDGGQASVMKAS